MRFFLFMFLLSTSCRESLIEATSVSQGEEKSEMLVPGETTKKGAPENCETCHAQVRNIGEEKFDAAGIYPLIDPLRFGKGNKVPVLIESLEIAAVKKTDRGRDLSDKNCLSCHLAHGAKTKDVTDIEDREENLGMWLALDVIDNILDVEVKFKTFKSGHRVPGGLASRAYVIVVQVEQEGELKLWHGPKLPYPLRTESRLAGLTMARFFVDENGKLTNDLKKARMLVDDTRLEHKRFLGEHFLYNIDPKKEATAKAILYYLPDFPTWKGALEVLSETESWEVK